MPNPLKEKLDKVKENLDKKVDKYFRRKSKGVKHSTFRVILYSSTFLATAQDITSTLEALHLDPSITISNPPETVESLHMYEKHPGEAQKFLGTIRIFLLFYFLNIN